MSGWDWPVLYRRARQVGVPAETFWALTPRELAAEFEIAAERAKDEYESIMLRAWCAEYVRLRVQHKKRLESFREYVQTEPAAQSADEMKTAMKQIATMYNLPYTETPHAESA